MGLCKLPWGSRCHNLGWLLDIFQMPLLLELGHQPGPRRMPLIPTTASLLMPLGMPAPRPGVDALEPNRGCSAFSVSGDVAVPGEDRFLEFPAAESRGARSEGRGAPRLQGACDTTQMRQKQRGRCTRSGKKRIPPFQMLRGKCQPFVYVPLP